MAVFTTQSPQLHSDKTENKISIKILRQLVFPGHRNYNSPSFTPPPPPSLSSAENIAHRAGENFRNLNPPSWKGTFDFYWHFKQLKTGDLTFRLNAFLLLKREHWESNKISIVWTWTRALFEQRPRRGERKRLEIYQFLAETRIFRILMKPFRVSASVGKMLLRGSVTRMGKSLPFGRIVFALGKVYLPLGELLGKILLLRAKYFKVYSPLGNFVMN